MTISTVDIAAVREAETFIAPHIRRTPLLNAPLLDEALGFKLYLKAECLQLTGSFKIRGALNKMLRLDKESHRNGVIAFSAGNHGQAVAAASRMVKTPATIVLPNVAPQIKVDRCKGWGARVVLYDPKTEDRREVSRAIAEREGLTLIHPFDDPLIMAGQGTVGLECVEQMTQFGLRPDAVLVNCSGGGLASGVFTAIRHSHPRLPFHLVEVAGFEKWHRALISGLPEVSDPVADTIMDGINGPIVGAAPLSTLRGAQLVNTLAVNDRQALVAMRVAFDHFKVVLEPGGAASLASALSEKASFQGKTIVVIASGGNVDPEIFARALASRGK